MKRIPVIVDTLSDLTTDIRLISLQPTGEEKLPSVKPGDHIDLFLQDGLVRQYSLINKPNETGRYQLAVKRDSASRGGSDYIHDKLFPGSRLDISTPRNNFTLDSGDDPVLLFAGGIGITPILSMIRSLIVSEREYKLAFFVRDENSVVFADELKASGGQSKICVGHDPEDTQKVVEEFLSQAASDVQIYVCGPLAFMDCVLSCADKQGIPPEVIRMESFTASSVVENADTFEVKLAKSGLNVIVGASETITEALLREGVEVDVSCEQGICGTCLTTVLEGVPKHEDMYLTDDEKEKGDQMCLCVSRSVNGLLVLDL